MAETFEFQGDIEATDSTLTLEVTPASDLGIEPQEAPKPVLEVTAGEGWEKSSPQLVLDGEGLTPAAATPAITLEVAPAPAASVTVSAPAPVAAPAPAPAPVPAPVAVEGDSGAPQGKAPAPVWRDRIPCAGRLTKRTLCGTLILVCSGPMGSVAE